ncbi:MAG: hypothetical protein JWQ43_102 [Glaciihabitans sp.]|nr:hypothetical protein [Glaciihabitans sp.]
MSSAGTAQRAILAMLISGPVMLGASGCARDAVIPAFEREQTESDVLPEDVAPGADVDLGSMRLLAEHNELDYYLAQDTIPGSPAVCLYAVEPGIGWTSTCDTLPFFLNMGPTEVQAVFASTETPHGLERLSPNLILVAEPRGGTRFDEK